MDVAGRVKRILADVLCIDASSINTEDSIFTDLRADSLDCVSMVMYAGEEFGVDISGEEAEEIVTVADVISLIAKKIAA